MIGDREDHQLISFAPTPTPAPTVTITLMPTPAPTVYVQVPDQGIDWVKDVLLGDFGGTVLAVVVTVLLARYAVSRALRDEQARHDLALAVERDRRDIDQAGRVLSAALQLDHAAVTRNEGIAYQAIYALIEGSSLLGRPRDADLHSEFRMWLRNITKQIGDPAGGAWAEMSDARVQALRDVLTPMVLGVRDWMVDPLAWSPPAGPRR